MSKSTYPTKYQLEHLKRRINSEIDPLIDQAELSVKSIVADLTESAELKLAKKIKADVVIKELEKAIQELEIKQRKAMTFFGKINNKELKENLSYKFRKSDNDNYYSRDSYGRGIQPSDCREQLRDWASHLAQKEAEKTKAGKRLKQLKLYQQSATDTLYSVGINKNLKETMSKILRPIGIVWDKAEALQIENKRSNLQ